jgi:hypothetical protein
VEAPAIGALELVIVSLPNLRLRLVAAFCKELVEELVVSARCGCHTRHGMSYHYITLVVG